VEGKMVNVDTILKAYSVEKKCVLLEMGGVEKWYPASTVINYVKPEMKGKKCQVTFDEEDGKKKIVFIKLSEENAFEGVKEKPAYKPISNEGYWDKKFEHEVAKSEEIGRMSALNTAVEIVKLAMRPDREYTIDGLTEAVKVTADTLREYAKNGH